VATTARPGTKVFGYGALFDFASAARARADAPREAAGAFKPDRRVYQLAVDRLGIPSAAIAFVCRGGTMRASPTATERLRIAGWQPVASTNQSSQ
jgi:hypothetical protein